MDDLRERVEAVERALTDGDGDLSALAEGAATAERVAELEATVEDLRDDVAELDAATQALRGYVGSVRSVNEDVERRAEAAVAAVDSLEERLSTLEAGRMGGPDGSTTTGGTPVSDGASVQRTAPEPTSGGEGHTDTTGCSHERTNEHGPSGGQACPTCGHTQGLGSTSDVGVTTMASESAAGEPSPDERGSAAARSAAGERGRSTVDRPVSRGPGLGEFDPEAQADRVTLRETDPDASPSSRRERASGGRAVAGGPGATGASDQGEGGFLARARDLL